MQTIKSKTTRDDKKMNRHPKNKTNETKTRSRRVILLLLLLSTLFWAAGCEDYYSSSRATTIPGHITQQTQSTSLTMIDVIIAALDTGMAACIMSGTPGYWAFRTGVSPGAPVSPAPTARYLTLVSSCGSMGVTSRKDTKPLRLARRRHVSRLPSRDQSTQQTEKRADECFPKNFSIFSACPDRRVPRCSNSTRIYFIRISGAACNGSFERARLRKYFHIGRSDG